jgi:O-antigen/teichoic acid export membrane protein
MIARKSLLIVSSRFFIQFLGIIGFVVLAKLWGSAAPAALGIIGFALSFLALFNIITDLGFSQAHIKRISEGQDLGTCIGTFSAVKIFLTILMVALVSGSYLIWKYVLNEGFTDATTESVFVVMIVYTIFSLLKSIPINTFVGKREIAKRQITEMSENLVKTPLLILVALAGVSGFVVAGEFYEASPLFEWPGILQPLQNFIADHGVGSLAVTYVFGMMATFFVGIWFLRKYPLKKPSRKLFKSYSTFAIPVAFSSVISILSTNIDKVMIGFFWTSVEVGYYFTVQRITGLITGISLAVGTLLFPTISKYHASKDYEGIKKTVHLSERYISMVLIPPIVVTMLFSSRIIEIVLDTAFLPAAPVLLALLFWVFVFGLSLPYSNLILGIDKPKIQAIIGVVVCTVNIVLNYLFIPENGLLSGITLVGPNGPFTLTGPTGAAVATGCSGLIFFFGTRLAAKKLTGIKLLQTHTIRHIVAGLVMGGVLYYLRSFIDAFRIYHLIAFAALGLAIYLAVLFLLREFKKEDFHFFIDLIHPKKMLGYVKSELKNEKEPPE